MMDVAPATPLVVFDRVRKDFGPARPVLEEVSFAVGRGEFVVLTGAGRSGKSTVLELMAGLLVPDGGRVTVAGEAPAKLCGAGRAALRRRMGVVTQVPHLLADRSLLENIMLPALAAGMLRSEARARGQSALQRFGLADRSAAPPHALSGSERRRAVLARAVANRPALLLLDEPAVGLDHAETADLMALLDDFVQAGASVFLTSRGPPEPLPRGARSLRLVDGRVLG